MGTMVDYIRKVRQDGTIERVPFNGAVNGITEPFKELSRDEWNALADVKLQDLLQNATGALLLAVIRESKDRLEGKPMARTELTGASGKDLIPSVITIEFVGKTIDN